MVYLWGTRSVLLGIAAMNTNMGDRAKTRYRRLPGRGPRRGGIIISPFSRCFLYIGDDHVLAVDNNGFSEDYKRFYFSDIQAIITRKTIRGMVWSIVLASLFACFLIPALLLGNEPFWVYSGAFLVLLLINLLRGPTCICHIMTAVQEEQLPSLNRLRVARKVISTLRLAIEKAQGILSPEEVNASQSEAIATPRPSLRNIRRPRVKERPIHRYNGTMHMVAFALMLTDGVLTGFDLLYHSPEMAAVTTLLTSIYCIFLIIAMVKQYGSTIPGTVRGITWVSTGFICASYILSSMVMGMMAPTLMAHRSREMITQWDMYRSLLNLSPQNSLPLMAFYVFSAAWALTLGTLGLIRVIKHRADSARAPRSYQNLGDGLTR
jgi:hypothetical protein